jgi:HD-GYP domain-containing protein (c-di-GMP phosphodiesterase class II)
MSGSALFMNNTSFGIPQRVAILYFIIGSVYIYISDQALLYFSTDAAVLRLLQTYKGWGYVVVTSVLLYGLLNNQLKQLLFEMEARRKAEREILASREVLVRAYDETIEGWGNALNLKDDEVEEHSHRVVEMTLQIAKKMNLDEEMLAHVKRGALLHDIGKIGVPDAILLKPGKLTEKEWEIMKRHPVYAYNVLDSIDYLKPALDIPYCHHEKWEGNGYPRGLKGNDIPLPARIFAVVDVYDALTSDRPYRKAWSKESALDHIIKESGRQFDPEVVDIFIEELKLETND